MQFPGQGYLVSLDAQNSFWSGLGPGPASGRKVPGRVGNQTFEGTGSWTSLSPPAHCSREPFVWGMEPPEAAGLQEGVQRSWTGGPEWVGFLNHGWEIVAGAVVVLFSVLGAPNDEGEGDSA